MCTRQAALGSIVMAIVGSAASAQNALDRPLDKNPQKGAGGLNTRTAPDIAAEVRFRNSIITGNAPGGLSFRGDVGYKAPGEFFGNLPSNDTFAFRRDSYYSGLGGMGIRATDALQYQFAMTTGNSPPPGFAGNFYLTRSGSGSNPALVSQGSNAALEGPAHTGGGIRPAEVNPDDPHADVRGLSLMSLRSPSAYVSERGLEPTVLGQLRSPEGQLTGVTASPLRGVAFDVDLGLNKKEEKPRNGLLSPIDTKVEQKAPDTKIEEKNDTKQDTKVDQNPAGRSSYDDLIDRLKKTGKPEAKEDKEKKAIPSWQQEIEDLRRQLSDTTSGLQTKPRPEDKTKTDQNAPETKPGEKPGEEKSGENKPGEKPSDEKKMPGEIRPKTVDLIRGAAAPVNRLVMPGYDPFATHMKAGEDYLGKGQFFFAEERFTAALAIKPGDPMAAIGRVHAQLGAGMFVSAAINLRALFAEHPEVTGLKYGPDLLPSPERAKILVDRLGAMADSKDARRRDTALLLAYLAFQNGDERLMRHGLAIMATPPEPAPGERAAEGPDQLQKLSTLLTGVWTKPKPEPEKPAESTK
jgi:hypothetical protein